MDREDLSTFVAATVSAFLHNSLFEAVKRCACA
jgi:hypothetical protein